MSWPLNITDYFFKGFSPPFFYFFQKTAIRLASDVLMMKKNYNKFFVTNQNIMLVYGNFLLHYGFKEWMEHEILRAVGQNSLSMFVNLCTGQAWQSELLKKCQFLISNPKSVTFCQIFSCSCSNLWDVISVENTENSYNAYYMSHSLKLLLFDQYGWYHNH